MGNDQSAALKPRVEALEFKTPFNHAELKSLAKRFTKASHGDLEMTPFQFRSYVAMDRSRSTIATHIFHDIDTDGDNSIGFEEFVVAHAKLGRGSVRDKLLYCFDLFDRDGDGKLTRDEGLSMIRCMSKSFANYVISIYNNPNDPRSPGRLAERNQKAKVGKELAKRALAGGSTEDVALDTLFNTADSSGDDELDRNEFVAFLKQFPECFEVLACFRVDPIKERASSSYEASAGAFAAY